MVARKPVAAARGKSAAAVRQRATVRVEAEERRHLVEDCAFFRAARFRAAGPGGIRKQDLEAAAAAIDAVILPNPKRAKRP